jgi:MFS family permease
VRASDTSPSPLARRLVLGQLFIGIGYGLITPSWFLYLDHVRGFGASMAGLSFTLRAIGMIVTVPLAGWMIDRRGPRGVVLVGTVCTTAGATGLGLSPWAGPALAGSLLIGAGTAFCVPATKVVLLNAVPLAQRTRVAALSFTTWNLGLGIGSLVGGFVADPRYLPSFVLLFLATGLLSVATRLVNLPAMPPYPAQRSAPGGSRLRTALRSRGFACYLGIAIALQFGGYGQTTAGLPGLATTLLAVRPSTIGIALAGNTATIVLMSSLTVRFARRRRSSTTLGLVGLLWAGAWALVIAGATSRQPNIAAAVIIVFYVIFGVGEALLAAVATPLVATLAPPGTLGTYLGLDTLTRQIGGALGPAVSGVLIADRAVMPYLTLNLGICLLAAPLALFLRRLLSRSQDAPPGFTVENPSHQQPSDSVA